MAPNPRHAHASAIARFHVAFGRALAFCGWSEGAARAFQDALAVEPSFSEARARLGDALSRSGRWAEACTVLEAACAQHTSDAELQAALVLALCRANRGADACTALKRLIDLRPNQAELHVLQGALLRRLHRSEEAIRSFRQAAQLPLSPQRFVLGELILGEAVWASVLQSLRSAPRRSSETPAVPGRTPLQQPPVVRGPRRF